MTFNIGKCKVLHAGYNNPGFQYNMNGTVLSEAEDEKDLGIRITRSLKPSMHCREAAAKANGVLKQILNAFHYRDRHTFLGLYKQYVRPHLEFASCAWSPWTNEDIETIEKIQKRAVSLISGLQGPNYEDKLKELRLDSLKDRRVRADMIQVYKILNGIDAVDSNTWFLTAGTLNRRATRLMTFDKNIIARRSRLEIRRNFFSQRVVNKWNELPLIVKNSKTLAAFKYRYDNNLVRFGASAADNID